MVRLLLDISDYVAVKVCFNPTMVRLLHSISTRVSEGEAVSIPQWCDCCHRFPLLGRGVNHRFNPTMVRLLRIREMSQRPNHRSFNPTMVRLLLE